jgi:O-antigen/teichoic acid export membrane protein
MSELSAAPRSSTIRRIQAANPLPTGTFSVAVGLLANGVGSYVFLALAGRGLGTAAFTPLSVLWALAFFAAPGLFLPLEQEVSRAVASRRARGVGAGPAVRQAALVGAGLLAGVLLLAVLTLPITYDRIFKSQTALFVGFVLIMVGYAIGHPLRGLLSGHGRFGDYSVYFGAEGIGRVVAATLLFVVGVETAGPYGIALGIIPFVAAATALIRPRGLLEPGPESRAGEVTASLGALLAASLLSAGLMNAGPIAVDLLATDAESEQAGRFLAGLVIARVPLFLFQAVQASLLPKLAHLAAGHQWVEFSSALRRLLLVVAGIGVSATLVGWAIGPQVVRLLFGPDFELGHRDFALLAMSSCWFMAAVALGQSLIALSSQARLALAWAVGMITFVIAVSLGDDLYLRVELALVAGTMAVCALLGAMLASELRRAGEALPAVPAS